MNPWRPLPLLRLVIPFICGTLTGIFCEVLVSFTLFFCILATACLALFLFHRFALSYRLRWLTGSVVLLSFFVWGFQLAGLNFRQDSIQLPDTEAAVILLLRASDCPSVRQGSASVITEMVSYRHSGAWKPLKTKLYLRLYGDKANTILSYGNYYLIYCRPDPLKFFHNTHSFNFREYLYNKGVKYETGKIGRAHV